MNILMIAGRLPLHPLDGGTTRVYHMAQQWSRRHRLVLVAPQFGRVDPDQIGQIAQEMGVEVHAVPVRIASKLRRGAAYVSQALRGGPAIDYYPEMGRAVRDLLRKGEFDVVELEGSGGGVYVPPLAGLSRRPTVVVVFYDVMWHWWKREFAGSRRAVPLVRWLSYRTWEPRLARNADSCVFMSEVDAALVASVAKPKRALVVPNGIETESFEITPLPDAPEVLFVGSFAHLPSKQAAVWLIREIWPALRRRVAGARLTLIGREPPPDLVALARSAAVTLHGNVPDVRPYYQRARTVIVPVQTGGGVRVKILEACAAARPIVTTRLGAEGLPLVPGKHALFADKAEDLAGALSLVLTDRGLAEQLAASGRRLVEREFSWDALARKQETAFCEE